MKASAQSEELAPRSLREIVQKKILDEVIGTTVNWKVLVMDETSTKVISSALTMYDIMERRITLVEKLELNRQPFPDIDVIYLATPTQTSVQKIAKDFENKLKPRYGNVHIYFLESVSSDLFAVIQSNSVLVNRVKSFKEIFLDFISHESNVFHFDLPNTLDKLYGALPDPDYPSLLGKKIANVCITLNEHPCIRFQGTSPYAREIATSLHQSLLQYKKANPTFWCNGDDSHHDRERAQILILDRNFDLLSPLMHEYTYQAMAFDLLCVEDGVIEYTASTNKGTEDVRKGVLNENDEFWMELRHSHIAKVIETIKERMNDIIQNNSGAALDKSKGANLDITTMAAAVKKLPEYTQTMTKLGQHVATAQQCMNAFSKLGLLNLSLVEQIISTGFDEDGNEVKGAKLFQKVSESLRTLTNKDQKIRLLAIYHLSQKHVPGEDYVKQAIQLASLNANEKKTVFNFDRLIPVQPPSATSSGGQSGDKKGMFSSIFRGKTVKHAPTPEGEYSDTRHVTQMKVLLEQFLAGELPLEKFPAMGPAIASSAKVEAKSVRKFGANSRWAKKDNVQYTGGRYIAFVAGGVSYSETRAGYELMQQHSKEVIIGSSHIITPDNYLVDVGSLDSTAASNTKKAEVV